MSKRLKVLLKNGHPHADEIGYIEVGEGDKINFFSPPGGNEKLFLISLEACKHGGGQLLRRAKGLRFIGGGKMKYYGYTHKVPMWLLPVWKKLCCRVDWHAWDEVTSVDEHYLVCDACDEVVDICDAPHVEQSIDIELDPRVLDPRVLAHLGELFYKEEVTP